MFEIVSRIGRRAYAPNYDPFDLADIRTSREEVENVRVADERERKKERGEEVIVKEGGGKIEACRKTQAGRSSSARPKACRIDQETINRLSA